MYSTTNKSYILPAGRYFIGDICYALSDCIIHEIWGEKFNFIDGLYTHQKGTFVMGRAMYGHGDYPGTDGRLYAVDSGIVGMVSWDLVDLKDEKQLCKLGSVHEFSEIVYFCNAKEGRFVISSGKVKLVIDTAPKVYVDFGSDEELEDEEDRR